MKKLWFIVFVVSSLFAFSQEDSNVVEYEKPDYDLIKKNIVDKSSDFYYPTLYNRYISGDSGLNLEESRHIYYGYRYNKDYNPYARVDGKIANKISNLLKKESLTTKEKKSLVQLLEKAVEIELFNIRYMSYQRFFYKELGEMEKFAKVGAKIDVVVNSLLSSGRGLDKDNPIYVIYVYNEYDYLFIWGLNSTSQSLVFPFDYLTLSENQYDLEALYFEVSPCLESLSKMFDE